MESESQNSLVVAIDGPAASGKSTVAKQLSQWLNFNYVDTGAMYRLATWFVLHRGISPTDESAIADAVSTTFFESGFRNKRSYVLVDGNDPGDEIRSELINRHVSQVSAIPKVRETLVDIQRYLGTLGPVVMEGRDIGSIVFPETPYKFYIDASPEIRQQRRSAQGQADSIASRDKYDSGRSTAPLMISEDASVVDSTHLTIDGVCGEIIGRLKVKGMQIPALTVVTASTGGKK